MVINPIMIKTISLECHFKASHIGVYPMVKPRLGMIITVVIVFTPVLKIGQ
jgi:hypothetical protein